MGCGSSREVTSDSAGNQLSSQAANQARLGTSHLPTSQVPLTQSSNQVSSPSTSRAAFHPQSSTSLPSPPALSSPRASSNRHRNRAATETTSSNLSDHYNAPLQYPKSWKSQSKIWTPSQLQRERRDFFDTRVTGQKEVWAALRQVSECLRERDLATAQGILNAVNITLPTGQLEDGCYDERGHLYRIPEEVLVDPTNIQPDSAEVDGETVIGVSTDAGAKLSSDTLDKQITSIPETILEKQEANSMNKGKDSVPEDAIQLKCRLSDRGSDVVSYIGKSEPLVILAGRLKDIAQIPSYARIELFYLGKKLDQKKLLEEQDYLEGHVLNVFVVGASK